MLPAEKDYHVNEQELLAVIEAVCAFRCYVDGVHSTLIADHKPDTYVDPQPTMSWRQTRWSECIQRLKFTWEDRPGRSSVADPLSRNPAYRSGPTLLLYAQLSVTTRARTAPVRDAAKSAPPVTALQPTI